MKKTELSVRHHGAAIIAMLLAGPAAAQTSVTLYGVLDAGVELSSAGKGTVTRVISGGQFASRWGLTGSEDLGDGLRAIFRLESGFNSERRHPRPKAAGHSDAKRLSACLTRPWARSPLAACPRRTTSGRRLPMRSAAGMPVACSR